MTTPDLRDLGVMAVGIGAGMVLMACFAGKDATVKYWRGRADYWFARAVRAEGSGVPSITREVAEQKAWRERRALTSPDHTNRHSVDATLDGEAAREILSLCIGEREVDE
jgi:hypothetical protein